MSVRFLVLEPRWPRNHYVRQTGAIINRDDEMPECYAGGYDHPTLFKTLRNARKAAAEAVKLHKLNQNPDAKSRVFLFNHDYLPEVLDDAFSPTMQLSIDDELAMAERQVELWVQRVEAIKRRAGAEVEEVADRVGGAQLELAHGLALESGK